MNKVKVRFEVLPSETEDYIEETVWAEPLGDSRYKILNSPFFVFGYSFQDIVIAETKDNEFPIVLKIDRKSGHSTYRINTNYKLDSNLFLFYWKELEKLGCSYENANGRLISVDVLPEANIQVVYNLLENGERHGIWDFQEADCVQNVSIHLHHSHCLHLIAYC